MSDTVGIVKRFSGDNWEVSLDATVEVDWTPKQRQCQRLLTRQRSAPVPTEIAGTLRQAAKNNLLFIDLRPCHCKPWSKKY